MAADAERHLLFGLIALTVGLIDQSQLVAAFHAWTRDKRRPLSDHLVAQGALEADGRAAVDAMVALHLKKHEGNLEKSLASIPLGRSTRERLAGVGDADIDASLQHDFSDSTEHDADRTATFSVGASTADGQRFRVLRPHARGGLGAVFVALDGELNREVALKQILDSHADDPASRRRFIVEAEVTGGLEHPGIVPVYGLGAHADGRPYYAMRFIRGESLKEAIGHFHQRKNTTLPSHLVGEGQGGGSGLAQNASRDRELRNLLRRFTDICNALAYAHARGVVHRDIKPGNVIVGKYGETLVVDWGLAKALGQADPSAGEATLVPSSASGSAETLPGSAIGTPAYMSPEQARGDLEALGPWSDVYSLGATLYCLLTGKPPFDGDDLGVILQRVQKGDFRRPRQLDRAIDPALEAICLKAMALVPADRYPSARALADDIDRWLADEPVTAYAEPLARRARRWAKRNRTLVASAAAALVMAAVGLGVVSAVQTRARNDLAAKNNDLDRQRARAEANEAQAIDAVKKFRDAVADEPVLKDSPELDALRKRLLGEPLAFFRSLRERLQGDGDTRPEVLTRLANVMHDYAHLADEIGDVRDGLRSHDESLAIWERLLAENPAEAGFQAGLAKIQFCRGNMLTETGKLIEARKAFDAAVAIQQKLVDAHPTVTEYQRSLALSHNSLGMLLNHTSAPAEARKAYEKALGLQQKLADAHPTVTAYQSDLAASHVNLGNLLHGTGAPTEARKAYEMAHVIRQRLAGAPKYQSELADGHNRRGVLLSETGAPIEARKAYELALAIQQKLVDAHPTVTNYQSDLAESYNNLGVLLYNTGATTEARKAFEEARAIQQKLADAHPNVTTYQNNLAGSHHNLGGLLSETGATTEARKSFELALVIRQKLADAHPTVIRYQSDLAASRHDLGGLLSATGAQTEARKSHELALVIRQKLADAHPTVTEYQSDLAASHNSLGLLLHGTAALTEARKAYELALMIRRKLADAHPDVTEYQRDLATSHYNLGNLLRETGKPAESRKAYKLALTIREKLATEHADDPKYVSDMGAVLNNTATLDIDAGQFAEARGLLKQAVDWQKKAFVIDPRNPTYRQFLAIHLANLIRSAHGLGRDDEAISVQRELAELKASDPRSAAIEARLTAVIKGEAPKNDAERLALAQRAYDTARHATAAGLWADSLKVDPKRAESRQTQHCYNAACAAALAGTGQSNDKPPPDVVAQAKLRQQAHDWLKSELAAWSNLLQSGSPEARANIAQNLHHWQEDTDLAGVRETAALQKLPADERMAWNALWAEWKRVLEKAQGARP